MLGWVIRRIETCVIEASDPVLHVPLIAWLSSSLDWSVLVEEFWLVDNAIVEEDRALIHVPRRVSEHGWVLQEDIVGVEQHDLLQLRLMNSKRLDPVALERFGKFFRENTLLHQLRANVDHFDVAIN